MKTSTLKRIIPLIVFMLFILFQVNAQKEEPDEMKVFQEIWGKEKKTLIEDYMEFSSTEANLFWPIYDNYMKKRQQLGAERIEIIMEYAENYENLTNEKADEIVEEVTSNDMNIIKLKKKYYNEMKKSVSAIRAAQFLQIENYIDTIIKFEIQNELPFIGEFEYEVN